MSVTYILMPVVLLLLALSVGAYVWSARKGQFDDLETPAMRILHEDDAIREEGAAAKHNGGPNPDPPSIP